MYWLSQNYQWVFSGIGVLIVGIFLERWRRASTRNTGATLTAQGARVSESPVASGSDINQNVNAPVFNVNIGQSALAPPQAEPARVVALRPEAPLLNMVVTVAHVTRVQRISHDVWSDNDSQVLDAFIVQFTNEARRSGQNVGGLVKAQLVYRDGLRELRRITGCWLNQAADMTEFRVDDVHSLMVGIILNGQFTTVAKRRVRVDLNADEIPTDVTALPGFEQGTVSVRLTHASTGNVLYEGQFQLKTRPPDIIRL